MKVRLTARAEGELERIQRRWRKHRPAVPDLVLEELASAQGELVDAPYSRSSCGEHKGRPLRIWLLPKTAYHVYYTVNDAKQTVVIHSIWGARRRRGPKLR